MGLRISAIAMLISSFLGCIIPLLLARFPRRRVSTHALFVSGTSGLASSSPLLSSAGFEKSILGAITKDPLSPSTDHVPNSPLQYNKHDLLERTSTDFVLANTGAAASEVSGAVPAVANFTIKGLAEDTIHLRGELLPIKRLQQVSEFWARSPIKLGLSAGSWAS